MTKIDFLVLDKTSGTYKRDGQDKAYFRVKIVIIGCSDNPALVGQVLNKYVDKEVWDSYIPCPNQIVSASVDLKAENEPRYADVHLSIKLPILTKGK